MPDQIPWTYDFPHRIAIPFAIWLFCVGGCIGSFLNVVIYRTPRGMNLARPGSRCPKCGVSIRWHDNIPILSWIWLRGQCRHCRLPIASRYMLVELLVAVLFLTLAMSELITAGASLPRSYSVREAGIWLVYLSHLSFLVTLLGVALIQHDGQRPPALLFLPATVVLVASMLLTEDFYPQPAFYSASQSTTFLLSLAGGFVAGCLAWIWERGLAGKADRTAWLSFILAGVVLGWQLTLLLAAGSLTVFSMLRLAGRGRIQVSLLMVAFTLAAVLIGRWNTAIHLSGLGER